MFIKRTGRNTNRVTQGRVYELVDDQILDDNGRLMSPAIDQSDYWVIVDRPPIYREFYIDTELAEEDKPMSKNSKLEITTVTYINGAPVSNFNSDDVIALIQAEEMKIQILDSLPKSIKEDSKAVKSLRAKHNDNVFKLVQVLDKHFTEHEYLLTSD